ncbi:MAG: helix-turn-helix transcriptional regulator [Deltaproteobacteria bacterium]|nr:helix-turn-helix transcriptional regulator [Deltaproteobacteria bacterium]
MGKAAATPRVLRQLGVRLRRAREAAGLSQEEAAARSGIDYKRWQRIEAGAANVTVRTLVRAAGACGVTFWELTAPAAASKPRRQAPR